MKIHLNLMAWLGVAISLVIFASHLSLAAETNAPVERVGIYDSRVIAYANFWTEAHQNKLKELVESAQRAKAAGQTERFKELEAAVKKEGERNHLQVFSTAPVDDILARMPEQVAAITNKTGVARLISKWDEKALKKIPRARQVDVTDRLLREFKLTEKQMKMIAELRKKKPLPLDKAEKLARAGKL